MPKIVKVWDAGDGKAEPVQIDMMAVKAREAIERDPDRYSMEKPAVGRRPPPPSMNTAAEDTTRKVEDAGDAVAKPDPLDHDGDGKKGGSKPRK